LGIGIALSDMKMDYTYDEMSARMEVLRAVYRRSGGGYPATFSFERIAADDHRVVLAALWAVMSYNWVNYGRFRWRTDLGLIMSEIDAAVQDLMSAGLVHGTPEQPWEHPRRSGALWFTEVGKWQARQWAAGREGRPELVYAVSRFLCELPFDPQLAGRIGETAGALLSAAAVMRREIDRPDVTLRLLDAVRDAHKLLSSCDDPDAARLLQVLSTPSGDPGSAE
jgi:hypothetical protein